MNIVIKIVPHKTQRYETLGDWYFDADGNLTICVSDTGDWRADTLVGLHELVEVMICKARGITEKDVTDFDLSHLDSDEPGDETDAPYRDEHCIASGVERIVAGAMGYAWKEYEDKTAFAY